MAEARSLLAAAIESMEADTRERDEQLARRDALRQTLDEARAVAHRERDAAHQAALRHQSLLTQRETIRGALRRAFEDIFASETRAGSPPV